MRSAVIYTDGGAEPNPGVGGWGAVIVDPTTGERRELSGGEAHTTNNRMELMAAIRALEALEPGHEVDLYTDSSYLRIGDHAVAAALEGRRMAHARRRLR